MKSLLDPPYDYPYAHTGELELFEKLGLKPGAAPHGEWQMVGVVAIHDRPITIEVMKMPAAFWRFTLAAWPADNQPVRTMTTGSGTLVDFWPTVLLLHTGMFKVKEGV